jgi:hypothetical protein
MFKIISCQQLAMDRSIPQRLYILQHAQKRSVEKRSERWQNKARDGEKAEFTQK